MEKQTIDIESVISFVYDNAVTGKPETYRATGKAKDISNSYEFVNEDGVEWIIQRSYFGALLLRGVIRDVKTSDWMKSLHYANETLEDKGCQIVISEPEEEGFFQCDIIVRRTETYAENYYENELTDLIEDAFHYANTL